MKSMRSGRRTSPAPSPIALKLSRALGMQIEKWYRVTRDSKHGEFRYGDRVRLEEDGAIVCPAAHGWMPPEDVIEATEGWAIEPTKRTRASR